MTDVERIKNTAKHLKDVSEEEINLAIDDAMIEIERFKIKHEGKKEKIIRYLAIHFLTLNYRRPESHSAPDISVNFSKEGEENGLNKTSFGQEAQRMIKEATGFNLVVV